MIDNIVIINALDRKILAELDKNSRLPYTQLAKKIHCPRAVVEYRVKKLIEQGIIISLSAFVNAATFGFTSWKVYVKLNKKDPQIKGELIQYVKNIKNVWWIIETEGAFDFMFSFLTKTVHEFYNILHSFQMKYSIHETSIEVTSHISTTFCTRGYLRNIQSTKISTVLEKPREEKIDKTDIIILKQVAKDTRIAATSISRDLHITPRIVTYRLKELQKNKIISHYRLIPDVNKMGFDYYKIMLQLHNLTEQREKALRYFLEIHPNIINYTGSWGPWELEFETELKGYKALIELVNTIRSTFPDILKETYHLLITKEHKPTNNFLDYLEY